MNKVTMVTGNIGKWKIASNIFKKYNVVLEHKKLDTPEIQSSSVEEVSKYSAEYAAKELNTAVIKSDVGYYIEDLNGFPGPFVKYINEMLTSEDILKIMKGKKNRKIILKECLTFACPDKETKQFLNIEEAYLSDKSYGEGTTFDKIIVFKGQLLPKSMNSDEENYKHFEETLIIYEKMAKYIERENIKVTNKIKM